MASLNLWLTICATSAVVMAACVAQAQEAISFAGPGGVQLKAMHYKAAGDEAVKPVVIALHGCGGLYAAAGARAGQPSVRLGARHHAMGEMLSAQGYHAIFPDSFSSRGITGVCSEMQRLKNGIRVGMDERRLDTLATLAWVQQQSWASADQNHIALLGWSHGAQTLLASTDKNHASVRAAGQPFKTAIAFYPGCVEAARTGYSPNTQLILILGADDDLTLPEPCIKLAEQLKANGNDVTVKVYPGAVHGFDNPIAGITTRSDVPSRSPARAGQGVQAGQDAAARQDSWGLVREILAKAFNRPAR